ncbi:hypothetical protein DSO57_1023675 [Entomophthora muscae]|uniref:Uncharacterized protein n=1 Tax=Entomophthora muscae TaxID=34485 RepID=A0ACC2SFN0_9FUNG|nr:hypothetical protein DSO57_1023675 [Entomophthora muscae]
MILFKSEFILLVAIAFKTTVPRLRAAQLAARRTPSLAACPRTPAASQPASPPPRPPTTASQSPTQPAEWGNCQKGNPKKAISPNPNGGGTAA